MIYCWQHVDEYLSYRKSLGLSTKTIGGFIKDFSGYLKQNYPEQTIINKDMCETWMIQRSTEQNSGYRSRISALRQFTRYLYPLGLSDFILDVGFLPKAVRYTPYIFTDEELIKIFDYAIIQSNEDRSSLKKLEVSIIYRLIYFCGLRPNEGREILISDIDFENRTIVIRKNKSHKERMIPVADDVNQMLAEYLPKLYSFTKNTQYLFPNSKNACHSARWLRIEFLKLWDNTKEENNSSRVRVYDLRHRWATATMTRFLNSGEDLMNLLPYMRAYMGHENFEETAYYIHLLPEKLLKNKNIDWEKMNSAIPEVNEYE